MVKKELIPGWLLMLGVGVVATFSSRLIVIGGKHPIEAVVIAIILGILIRNTVSLPPIFLPGVKAFEKILILGIVLIGASLNFKTIGSQGPTMLAIIIITMAASFVLIFFLGRLFKLPIPLAILLAVGTTICGGSAIAVTAPLIKAKEEETSYAIGTIALWGLVAILFYPKIAQLMHVSDLHFGVFAGTAIHSTPQVVGAGFIFSELAGKTATAVKLIRNCFMVPLAFLIALWFTGKHLTKSSTNRQGIALNVAKAFPWFLFGYFLLAGMNTLGYFSPTGTAAFNTSGRFLILLGLAGIGLNTNFRSFNQVGIKPLLVGLFGSVIVASISIILITSLL
ncbi:MAG TPA: putative sulfate exporter family transporter [Candidatus Aminicenantes bacterium]|nr:putative sulfate exporter family transporter [Candidatus Aminicenantes bacterium]